MNLGSLVEDNIKRFGEYESVYFEDKWYTNLEMNRNSNRLGNTLKSLGVEKGDRMAIQAPNCPQVYTTFTATYKIGAIVVPLNPFLRPDQAAYIYRDCGAKVVITTTDFLPWVKEAQKDAPDLKHIILIDRDDVSDTISYAGLLSSNSDELLMEDTDNDDVAALIYTAGTTGLPKGVMHTHYSIYTCAMGFYEWLTVLRPVNLRVTTHSLDLKTLQPINAVEHTTGVDRTVVSLGVLPLSHSYGIAFSNLGLLWGPKTIMLKWWNPEEALKSIEKFRVTHLAAVPTMYIHMLSHPDLDKYDLSSLKDYNSGAAPLPIEVAMQWKKRVRIDIKEGWGMTESGATTAGQPANLPPRYGSVGKSLVKANSLKVFDDNGHELPPGKTGEIVVKGPTVMKGYWNLPEETAKTIKNGWLYTGDIGYMDKDGYFYITDRKKDIIIRGGENISPREVEEVLVQHPKIAEAGVVGVPDKIYGEEVKACVVLKAGENVTEEEILAFCRERLPTAPRPKKVQFVDALPKNLLGKVLRAELRKLG